MRIVEIHPDEDLFAYINRINGWLTTPSTDSYWARPMILRTVMPLEILLLLITGTSCLTLFNLYFSKKED